LFVFFFSSRRRHTRFSRDWSSDVCSSDLIAEDVDDSGLGELGLPGASAAAKIVIEGGALLKGGDISLRASAQAQDQWDVTAARQIGRASWRERVESREVGVEREITERRMR